MSRIRIGPDWLVDMERSIIYLKWDFNHYGSSVSLKGLDTSMAA
jgi:hypothetical protein